MGKGRGTPLRPREGAGGPDPPHPEVGRHVAHCCALVGVGQWGAGRSEWGGPQSGGGSKVAAWACGLGGCQQRCQLWPVPRPQCLEVAQGGLRGRGAGWVLAEDPRPSTAGLRPGVLLPRAQSCGPAVSPLPVTAQPLGTATGAARVGEEVPVATEPRRVDGCSGDLAMLRGTAPSNGRASSPAALREHLATLGSSWEGGQSRAQASGPCPSEGGGRPGTSARWGPVGDCADLPWGLPLFPVLRLLT